MKFSRGFEAEADYLGVQTIYHAGYDPSAFVSFFEKIQAMEKSSCMAKVRSVPFTLRIEPQERSALESLSKVEGRPVSQLLNDAIKSYLRRRGRNERSLEANLAKLRAYRKQDPGFQKAKAAFVEAEASFEDPVEGEPIEQFDIEDMLKPGPVQSRIRDILDA